MSQGARKSTRLAESATKQSETEPEPEKCYFCGNQHESVPGLLRCWRKEAADLTLDERRNKFIRTPELRDFLQANKFVLCGLCWLPYTFKYTGHTCDHQPGSSVDTDYKIFKYQSVKKISASVDGASPDEEEVRVCFFRIVFMFSCLYRRPHPWNLATSAINNMDRRLSCLNVGTKRSLTSPWMREGRYSWTHRSFVTSYRRMGGSSAGAVGAPT